MTQEPIDKIDPDLDPAEQVPLETLEDDDAGDA